MPSHTASCCVCFLVLLLSLLLREHNFRILNTKLPNISKTQFRTMFLRLFLLEMGARAHFFLRFSPFVLLYSHLLTHSLFVSLSWLLIWIIIILMLPILHLMLPFAACRYIISTTQRLFFVFAFAVCILSMCRYALGTLLISSISLLFLIINNNSVHKSRSLISATNSEKERRRAAKKTTATTRRSIPYAWILFSRSI